MRTIVQSLADNGPQSDASNSEFLQAAVHLIFRIHHSVNYAKLRPRGRWGEDSAREFIETLSGCYFKALGDQYVREHYKEVRAAIESDQERDRHRQERSERELSSEGVV